MPNDNGVRMTKPQTAKSSKMIHVELLEEIVLCLLDPRLKRAERAERKFKELLTVMQDEEMQSV
jgi:hypothetical protein